MNRRVLLKSLLALMMVPLLLSGCAGQTTPKVEPEASATETSANTTVTTAAPTTADTSDTTDPENPSQSAQSTEGESVDPTTGKTNADAVVTSSGQARPWVTATKGTGTTTSTTQGGNPSDHIYTKAELYQLVKYLTDKTDRYAVGAHFYGNLDVKNRIRAFEKSTGKQPAFVDFDMNSLPFTTERTVKSAVSQLTDYVKGGGFVTITDHWLTPTKNVAEASKGGANNSRTLLTKAEYDEVMTPGTTLNKNFMDELKYKSDFLKQLRDAGIPVIYRPLHEGNMGWSWWGIHTDRGITGEDTARLFRFVHDYFTKTCGLDNILWQFNVGINGDQNVLCDWYPGDKYVDLLSLDWYLPHNNYKDYYEKIIAKCGNKPFAVSEYGGDGDYDTSKFPLTETLSKLEKYINQGAKAAYVGLYFDMPSGQNWALSSKAITLNEMSGFWTKSKN